MYYVVKNFRCGKFLIVGHFEHYKEIFELPSDAKYLDCKEEKYTKSKSLVELNWAHHNPERDIFS